MTEKQMICAFFLNVFPSCGCVRMTLDLPLASHMRVGHMQVFTPPPDASQMH